MMINLWLNLENWRLHRHFETVLKILRAQDISHLPLHLQKARKLHIERLEAYAHRGIFPRNQESIAYTPCFIDHEGRECAVAHLLLQSEQSQLANKISAIANTAYVPQMQFPELEAWAADAGLSKEELTLIQPGYWASFWDFAGVAFGVWVFGLSGIVFHGVQIIRKRRASLLSALMALPLLCGGLFLLLNALAAHSLSTYTVDVPEYIRNAAGKDVDGLGWGAVFTLLLAAIQLGLMMYRREKFPSFRKNRRKKRAN
jgi:hypothetical protein